jgi:GNAT superfamily N-acetyltransferase
MHDASPFLTIRRANAADALAIARIHIDTRREAYRNVLHEVALASMECDEFVALWSARLTGASDIRVAGTQAGDAIAFSSAGAARDSLTGYQSELYALYVRPEYHGQGAGSALLGASIQSARSLSEHLYVWTLADGPAVPFYLHLGGIQIATRDILIHNVTYREIAFGYP